MFLSRVAWYQTGIKLHGHRHLRISPLSAVALRCQHEDQTCLELFSRLSQYQFAVHFVRLYTCTITKTSRSIVKVKTGFGTDKVYM